MKLPLLATLCLAAVLSAPAAARAGVFAGDVIDGPSPDIVRVGDVDLARDGTGAVVYVKRDAGVEHVFMSRLEAGVWQPPERVDAGLNEPGSDPAVAASDGGRLTIAFVSGSTLYAVVRPAGAPSLPAPQLIGAPARTPSVDMSTLGAAYIAYASGSDVRAARLDRTATTFAELGGPLDVDPAQPAGDNAARRPDVAIAADGTGVVTWGERAGDGRDHAYARRLFNASISTAPQDLTLADFEGHRAGDAEAPDVDIEDDSSYAWVTFRQTVDGTPRAMARRLVGSEFQPPAPVDPFGLPAAEGVDFTSIDLSGVGAGLVASSSASSHQVYVSPLQDDAFPKGSPRVDAAANTIAPRPLTGIAQNGDGFVTWLQSTGAGDPALLRARVFDDKEGFAPEAPLSNPDFGPIDTSAGYDAAVDRLNDGAVVAIQAAGNDRRLVAGMIDRAPGSFLGLTTTKLRRFEGLRWSESLDVWGKPTYTVFIDGKAIGTTQSTEWKQPIPDGVRRWRVVATDRRGQTNVTKTRTVRSDSTPPRLSVRISGARRAGRLLRFRFGARDVLKKAASGLARIRVRWGDGGGGVTGKRAAHVYRKGSYTLRVTAVDKVGNVKVVRKRLRIR